MRNFLIVIGFVFLNFNSISQVWINEIHYDNNSTDVNEGIELAGIAGTNLSCYNIVLYNGSGGATYSPIGNSTSTIANQSCGYGTVWIPISGIQNGNPDAIALFNTCTNTVIQFISYGGVVTATNGDANGLTSTDIGVSEPSNSPVGNSLQLTGTGITYSSFTWQSSAASSTGTINAGQSFCVSSNTITTGTVSTSPFIVNCNTTSSGTLAYTSAGTFNAGNVFTAQLSNSTGSFASPINIGTLTGAGAEGANPGGTINITIPAGTPTGAGYRIRVVSSNPAVIGTDNGTDFSITLNPCTITTDAVSGGPFTVDCSTTDSGSIDFTSVGTFTAGNTYTAQLSDENGDFTSPTTIGSLVSTANSGTIPITIPTGTVSGTLYRIRVISDNPALVGSDNGADLTITNNCSITTGVVSSSSFSISCSAGTNGTVDFTASGVMQAGNIYSAQLSDASGNFTASTTVGTLSSTASSGTISFTIPASIPTGSGYLIRVIASTPSTTGTSSSAITITLTDGPCLQEPPHLTSVIINSCDPTCSEGYNEIVFGTSGDYSFDVNTSNFDFLYGSTNPGTNYTDVLVNNATGINQLNTAAGCPGLFVDALGTTVPANASWMLVYTSICEEALSWSGLCGSGPIYVIFQNDANWLTSGNFANNPSATSPLRYFRTGITTTSGSTFTINYTIDGNQYPDSDGVYASFDSDGGAATAYGDNNCILSPTLLPSTLISFNGEYINSTSELSWQTTSEQNNSHFTISHTTDGKQFTPIGTVSGAGNSSEALNYRYIHQFPHPGMNYYKLQSTDYDGTTYEKGIVAVKAEFSFSFYDVQTSSIELYYESDIEIYSMDGKLIEIALETQSIPFNKSGFFFILDKRSGITERLFIP